MGAADEAQYMAGYNAGRTACLRSGTTLDAHRWLQMHQRGLPVAFVAGYEWALLDYADANGLPEPLAGAS